MENIIEQQVKAYNDTIKNYMDLQQSKLQKKLK